MNRFPSLRLPVALVAAAMLFWTSCETTGDGPDIGVLPPGDIIGMKFTDTVKIDWRSVRVDSMDTYRQDRLLVGNYVDPQFGRISGEIFTQFISQSGLDFGDATNLQFDSLVLILNIESSYGRPTTAQTLRVHTLADTFPAADSISSLTRIAYHPKDLSNSRRLTLSAGNGQYRIRLADSLGQRLLFADADSLGERSLFQQLFKGLHIATDPVDFYSREPGALYTILITSENTRLRLYYKRRPSASEAFAAKVQDFTIISTTPRFGYVNRSELSGKLLSTELTAPDDRRVFEFVQGVSYIHGLIKFPDITSLGSLAISRAELVLKVDPATLGSKNRFLPPVNLLAVAPDSLGEPSRNAAGLLITVSEAAAYDDDTDTYTFNLTQYIQELISLRRENEGFILIPQNAIYQPNRVVLGGIDHPTLAPKLRITYSSLPQ
ncbi:MAG: DUF4270 family protein [Bacteroidia bacterium]|nr:DUF4270 family protein [Bacteroidia bacterium]